MSRRDDGNKGSTIGFELEVANPRAFIGAGLFGGASQKKIDIEPSTDEKNQATIEFVTSSPK